MSVETDALAAHALLLEEQMMASRGQPGSGVVYSPHQQITGLAQGVASTAEYGDPTPNPAAPAVEQVPGQADAHPGTYTLGREDA